MKWFGCLIANAAALCLPMVVAAQNFDQQPPSREPLIREEFTPGDFGEAGTSLSAARGAFLEIDGLKAGEHLRAAAGRLRESAANVAEESRSALHEAAADLEKVAKRVENRSLASLHEFDRNLARAYHSMAQHQVQMGLHAWERREHHRAGWRLRAAADNLEHSARLSGQRLGEGAQEVVRESRLLSAKLVAGTGYAVDDVGRVFESLGQQVEAVGQHMEPPTKRYLERLATPR